MTDKQEEHPSSVLRVGTAAIVDSSTATLIPDLSTIPSLPRYLPGGNGRPVGGSERLSRFPKGSADSSAAAPLGANGWLQ